MFSVFYLFFLLAGAHEMDELERNINDLISGQKATYGIVFQEVGKDGHVMLGADVIMHAASTMKVPVMLRLFEMIEKRELSLDREIKVKNSFISIADGRPFSVTEDSEQDLYGSVGKTVSLEKLVILMITRSSNLATNVLMELAEAKKIQELMVKLGANDIQVLRGVEDLAAYRAGLNNTSTAHDMARLLLACVHSDYFSESSRKKMNEILCAQEFKEMIPAGLPKDSNCVVAHKTGSISTVQHDAAIIYLPDGRTYILVIFSCDFQDERQRVKQTMREISGVVYGYMMDSSILP